MEGTIPLWIWPETAFFTLAPGLFQKPQQNPSAGTSIAKGATNKNHYRLYSDSDTLPESGAPPGIFVEGAFIMELLISLLVGFGISLVLFYRK